MPDRLLSLLACHAEEAAHSLARARAALARTDDPLVPSVTAAAAVCDAVQLVGEAVAEAEQLIALAPAALARLQRPARRVRWDLADRPLRLKGGGR